MPETSNTTAKRFSPTADPAFSVLGDGNVGIGTTDPLAKLDVAGAIAVHGQTVVDAQGQWVGDPTGLQGPPGPPGDSLPRGMQEFAVGEHTWVAPDGIYRVMVELRGGSGGGGGGGFSYTSGDPPSCVFGGFGGGGGGGGYLRLLVDVIPGKTYIVRVGSGGSGGSEGMPTTFERVGGEDEAIILAIAGGGGAGGVGGADGQDGAAGAGGSVDAFEVEALVVRPGRAAGVFNWPGSTAAGTVSPPHAGDGSAGGLTFGSPYLFGGQGGIPKYCCWIIR